MFERSKLASALVLVSVGLAACGGTVEKADPNPTPHDMKDGPGLFSGDDGDILKGLLKGIGEKKKESLASSLAVNPYLWRSSLETVSFMPITQADSSGGVIVTDWYSNPNNSDERVKLNVYILGRSLMAQNLKVKVFKQVKASGGWKDAEADEVVERQMEETILTSARALRIKDKAAN